MNKMMFVKILCATAMAISLFYIVLLSGLELSSETNAPETNSVGIP